MVTLAHPIPLLVLVSRAFVATGHLLIHLFLWSRVSWANYDYKHNRKHKYLIKPVHGYPTYMYCTIVCVLVQCLAPFDGNLSNLILASFLNNIVHLHGCIMYTHYILHCIGYFLSGIHLTCLCVPDIWQSFLIGGLALIHVCAQWLFKRFVNNSTDFDAFRQIYFLHVDEPSKRQSHRET